MKRTETKLNYWIKYKQKMKITYKKGENENDNDIINNNIIDKWTNR